ncbi:MAG: pyridoxamine 5'-phosphate oxidase family protein [Rhodoferax sp.]|nr:pyridoxamine 5'-phosphate oxidase family protein [Rhodoferax sp.]MBK9234737.1 pyridoxamine 5'-phosphate oxidase family protein [Rhodoferax sp.]
MSRAYSDIAFTPTVRAMQSRMGSRSGYEGLDHADDRRDRLTQREAEFIAARDGFYQASVSETGWPYVQFRGGPPGFLKMLDEKTLGYADFRGNVQYISVGNLQGNDRVSIILMDYANQRRLKILGRVRFVSESEGPTLMARLELPDYRARVERVVLITVEAYDWNCPQHITPRFTEAESRERVAPLHAEIAALKHALALARKAPVSTAGPE